MPDEINLDEPGHRVVPVRPGRTGIWDFSKEPGLVWDRPRSTSFPLSPASFRSIVAALIRISSAASSSLNTNSPSRRSMGTSTGNIGARRLPAGALNTAQHTTSASMICGP